MAEQSTETKPEEKTIPFFPDHALNEAKLAWVVLIIVLIAGLILPIHTGEPADPMVTPPHTKPEWYFLGFYQLLKFIPPDIGASLMVAAMLIVLVWPFIDRGGRQRPYARWLRWGFVVIFSAVYLGLTIWGALS
jgi:ubiquinol-cytochrome c reductase cytochrome b subunit